MNRKDEAIRWFKEAEEELITARMCFETKRFSACCFWTQQGVEKALKSFIFLKGENAIFEHSLVTLLKMCEKYDNKFNEFYKEAKILDGYYIPTRYPNGLPYPAIPSLFYDEKDAKEAIEIATKMINFIKEKIYE